ncbi:D-3-phosphoglycerate dehydrogenase [Ekhidna lutea]|uniref:D-3-phosphoglycerate dehydrogenase n=1 Tax=Ekhidna lutea TaxID=447679 RepID=A0A239HCX8_EKHLU|nr:phosphoglycerate dehydrogenase [Ekhidna lutea]SNS79011.1 D-3-phosphoglycerate dehydrogenase [Ekhidna lutea]
MEQTKYFIIDFDSTFTQVEALDVLAEISLKDNENQSNAIADIKTITDQGMEGGMSFRESLKKRVDILQGNKEHLPELVDRLSSLVSPSFKRNTEFINKYKDQIYIVSNGFKDFIVPIVSKFGIKEENVFANEFTYDDTGNIIGFDEGNILSENNGKPRQIESLGLKGEVFVLGDGFTDFEIKKAGLAHKFYAFTENVRREKILNEADHEAPSLDEFLFTQKLERAHSYPKNRIKALLLENIHEGAIKRLKEEGYQVDVHPAGMTEDELAEAIKDVSLLGIRSKTMVTEKVLSKAKRLLSIGAFCIGTNQIDLSAALKKGVAVFNAPFSNTRSVVELALAEIIMLMRNLPDKMTQMHQGKWNKSASGSFEIRGKTLGIIGYGKIGSQLSVLAESIGMNVQYFDIEEKLALGNATACPSLEHLLMSSDIISIHVDGRPENEFMIAHHEFEQMKQGVVFINLSRGHIVDIDALAKNIENGKIHGASVDVFPEEPLSNDHPFKSPLMGMKNTILTPHVGGSTLEAQENIADFVPSKIIEYINTGSTTNSVNFPNITLPTLSQAHRFIHIHKNEPGILAEINNVLAKHGINIGGQYLKTNDLVGYVITDIDKNYKEEVIKDLKMVRGTIRFRVLY